MTRRFFGTDGIRDRANEEPVTAETALRVAMAAGAHFANGDSRGLAVIGKDTMGISLRTVQWIWAAFNLQPQAIATAIASVCKLRTSIRCPKNGVHPTLRSNATRPGHVGGPVNPLERKADEAPDIPLVSWI